MMCQTLEPPHTVVLVVSYSASTVSAVTAITLSRRVYQGRAPVSPYCVRVIAITQRKTRSRRSGPKVLNSSTLGDRPRFPGTTYANGLQGHRYCLPFRGSAVAPYDQVVS